MTSTESHDGRGAGLPKPGGGPVPALPEPFAGWLAGRGWRLHPHQAEMLTLAETGRSALLIAPTGGGKTLAGFLPSLVDLAAAPRDGLHTLYLSPLKALAVDIQRNLQTPIAEMGLPITAETRTGDTPQARRVRQRKRPPNLLMTTPESLALLLSYADAAGLFASLRCIVVDELHALAGTKRGDLLALGLARLATLAPKARRIGLSATVAHPAALAAWLSPDASDPGRVALVRGGAGIRPEIAILNTRARLPWSGHMAVHALPEVYAAIRKAGTTLVFVNTRAQAEIVFHGLWRLNEDVLPIALHHGSLSVEQRRKVEAAMARGSLKAVVATSSLDLGVDWAAVDLVVQIGAPKGASRLLQRLGRANHRLDRPSRCLLVPANRFEVLECDAARAAIAAMTLDGEKPGPGGLDVLAQHLLGMACAGPFDADAAYAEIVRAGPYAHLGRTAFDRVLDFVATGGYALRAYERYQRLRQDEQGRWRLAHPRDVRRYRMNVGVIVEEPTMKVRLANGRSLGEVEEHFILGLVPGDTFVFAGDLLRFDGIRETSAIVTRARGDAPRIPAYAGGRLPLTTHLAERVRALLERDEAWPTLPLAVEDWLRMQQWRSLLPRRDGLLVESFPRGDKEYLVAYCFEGRNAHQTLGMLLTRRLERLGLRPLGFVATDYVIATWGLRAPDSRQVAELFEEDMLGDDLEAWMDESSLLKRTFRHVGVIAGLIERRHPGHEKTGRQMTVNSDLIYDVLRRHDPDHVLLQATRQDAARGLTDIGRLAALLRRIQGRIAFRRLDRVSPLAVPVLLEIGKEQVYGAGLDALFEEAEEDLVAEALPAAETGALPF